MTNGLQVPENACVSDAGPISSSSTVLAKDPALLARLVIKEGKPFYASALQAGYADATARRGAAFLENCSTVVREAFKREREALAVSLDKLKPLAIVRLHSEITNPKSPFGLKAIEIAGRFKETDWFVRNADVQIGIFNSLAEESPAEKAIEAYKADE